MALLLSNFLCCASAFVMCLLLLLLAMEPRPAYGQGICASAITTRGYNCHEVYVTTQDGYILNLQRLPEGRNGGEKAGIGTGRQPVIVQHGVLVDGMTWFLNSPEQNLPMILADNGFDVWIANTRGTRFSRGHTTLDPTRPAFWNWTWDELVVYDLPAVFDYVHGETGQKVHYVGHSLGTLIALASFSEWRLVEQLKSAALLSPIAYLSHMSTSLGVLAAKTLVGEVYELLGVAEFNPVGPPVSNLVKAMCANPGVHCYDMIGAITGKNCCLNSSTIDLLLKNEPQPTSTKNMMHLVQTVRTGALTKYNYGRPDYNIMHYGDVYPPIYNLSNIPRSLPLFLSYGGADALSDTRDVSKLLDHLKFHDVDKLSVQYVNDYGHADFIMGTNAKDIVYNAVVSFFKLHY